MITGRYRWSLTLFLMMALAAPAMGADLICGGQQTVSYAGHTVQEFTIPLIDPPQQIRLTAEGADGGSGVAGKNPGHCERRGGFGAVASAVFVVGSNAGELEPGGTLRFIVGEQGQDGPLSGPTGGEAGGGGGGSAVLYQPEGGGDWEILVAGGAGGGGYQGVFFGACVDADTGQAGRTGQSGGDGGGLGGDGGSAGDGGGSNWDNAGYFTSTGGGGACGSATRDDNHTPDGGNAGFPSGGNGATFELNDGGWGFGGGGGGHDDGGVLGISGGGGGGGYSGGGGGAANKGGGGGGSFITPDFTSFGDVVSGDTSPDNGQAFYQCLDSNDACENAFVIIESPGPGIPAAQGDTLLATQDGTAPCGNSNSSPDVWYAYKARCHGTVTVRHLLFTPPSPTVLSLHPSCEAAAVECSDEGEVSLVMAFDESILIRVAGHNGAPTPYALELLVAATVPPNDVVANAIAVSDGVTVSGTTCGANQAASASCVGGNTPDVWYSYRNETGCDLTVTLNAIAGQTIVVSARATANGQELACDGGAGSATITWDVPAGAEHFIRVSTSFDRFSFFTSSTLTTDSDGDGVCDDLDICPDFDDNDDADADGVPDGCDVCPGGDDIVDSDGDGVPDNCDACPNDPNPTITNLDTGLTYTSLQNALNAITNGQTIQLGAGTLCEDDITFPIGVDCTVTGTGMDETLIDGGDDDADRVFNLVGTGQTAATVITNLSVTNSGGGDAVFIENATPTLQFVRFLNCSNNNALDVHSSSLIDRCVFTGAFDQFETVEVGGDATLRQCLFADNDVTRAVRAVGGSPSLVNCTVDASATAIASVGENTVFNLSNSIFVGSVTTFNGASISASRCLYAGATGDNINGLATFVDAPNGDYRLAGGSLGIDAADDVAYAAAGGGPTDLGGDDRLFDDICTTDTGSGTFTYLDIGAYEYQGSGDSDGDGVPDDCDLCPNDNPDDSDGDGVCDSADLCPDFDDNVDSDADGVPDACDNCPDDANSDQLNSDALNPAFLPVAVWRFEDGTGTTASDELGTWDGTVVGPSWTTGRQGGGLDFDGSVTTNNHRVEIGDVPELSDVPAFTVAFWFQRRSDRTGDGNQTNHNIDNVMIAKSSVSANDNIEIGSSGADLELYLDTAVIDNITTPYLVRGVVTDGEWTHLALTYDSSRKDEVEIYINGVLAVAEDRWHGDLDQSNGSPLTLGVARQDAVDPLGDFDGLLDEIAIFSRALSDSEVAMIFLGLGDGAGDACDSCPSYDNGADADGDGVPDGCDPCPNDNPDDSDNDTVCDSADICPGFDDNVDTDNDNIPDGCDACAGGAASGDTDANGSVDLDDYTDLEACLLGPDGGLGTGCECFDFDSDNDVDLKNYATLQAAFSG